MFSHLIAGHIERTQHLPADRRLDIDGGFGRFQSHQDVPRGHVRSLCDIPLQENGILASISCGGYANVGSHAAPLKVSEGSAQMRAGRQYLNP